MSSTGEREPATDGDGGTYVVLLRGINVGGRNVLPMRQLAAMCSELGGREVRTYIQSGNVVLAATAELALRLPDELASLIEARAGLGVPVVLRSARELEAVERRADVGHLHVMFLADTPSPEAVARLDPGRSPGDAFVARGREIYLHCPNGVARSKLTSQYFDSRLGTVTTARNWRTVLKLAEMAGA